MRRKITARRKTTASLGLSAALVAATFVATGLAPSAAAEPRSDSGATSKALASPGLLDAMERDLGLSPAAARERLADERQAVKTERAARKAAGSAYAGSWFDAESGKLTVALTGRQAAGEVRDAGADVEIVKHSAATLDAAKKRVDKLKAPDNVASWRVDAKANRLVVDVVRGHRADNDVSTFLRKARATAGAPVQVGTVPAGPSTFAAGTVGGDPYYTGNVRCSIGFSVQGGFVTAGHCGKAGAGVRGWDNSTIGTFQGSSFPDNDYAWVSVGNGWWTVPVVLGWGTIPDRLVKGSSEMPVGTSICRSGSTTKWHCGNLLAKNETVNYSDGTIVHQLTKTSVCAEGGDSGGSFISGDQAQGVTSGGWGNCSSGGETWFQPVNEILQRYGLRLHTA
ncbi:S1 family peptidase [Streptomyces formicae]|uniref:Streptogrisin-C (Serine protease C) (SGPC) n=1 Tax=Streptomyces formicae TaxID=1616117 RepID=A0A291QHT4_9ACTN|nr:S1 family peptidase [Streptomyces formicae]ATL31162.1 Streptogrisin-C precursor (Serine protease C) (SGPC) [Streptomyces formicae]